MLTTILSIVGVLIKSGWVGKILALLGAWLLPSPLQRVANKQADVIAAEKKARLPAHDVTDLDKLP